MLNTVSTLCPPIINTLLWGNSELPRESDTELFLTVQNFVLRMKRFVIQSVLYILSIYSTLYVVVFYRFSICFI